MKYLVSIYVILLCGCGNLYANDNQDNTTISLVKESNQSECNNSDVMQSFHDLMTQFLQSNVSQNINKIRATDNEVAEEEEVASIKKDKTSSVYFSTVLYAEQLGCLCNNIKKRLPQSKFFARFLTNKLHIIFSVFRI